jgi:polyphosphate kinase 2 (PPK2 family)
LDTEESKSRAKISTRNIHQLRISTQKLEAILTLANSLKSNHNSKNVIFPIKKVRKSLGPLRDIQVESTALKGLELTQSLQKRLYDLLYLMFAHGQHSLLIILQGIDTSGKDGTVRHIFAGANPQGLKVFSFKRPNL